MLRQKGQLKVFTISSFVCVNIPLNKQPPLIIHFEEYKIPSKCKADIKLKLEKKGFDRKYVLPKL